jgi:hypothetical protein
MCNATYRTTFVSDRRPGGIADLSCVEKMKSLLDRLGFKSTMRDIAARPELATGSNYYYSIPRFEVSTGHDMPQVTI